MINGEVIYDNRVSKNYPNHARLDVFCQTMNPCAEVAEAARLYGNAHQVMALACLLPEHRLENKVNDWSGVDTEDIFGDYRLDNYPGSH